MRTLSFPLVSLGSDAELLPDTADIAEWIAKIKGNEADFISYETDTLLQAQHPAVSYPAAGGAFYTPRLYEVFGIKDTLLSNAPELNISVVAGDIRLVKCTAKKSGFGQFRFSLVSPLSLEYTDRYYHDAEEANEALVRAYSTLCREMRDLGVSGAVILSDSPKEIELELLHGNKYLWSVPEEALEDVLEFTRDVVLPAAAVPHLEELSDSYTLRNVFIKDADTASLGKALETIDKDHLFTAGYRAADAEKDYWKKLSELRVSAEEI
ncbi:MAG: hypothetical protein KBS37_03265 [Methanocorpusculum sp.]|nr:hypothetical protein [Candidatus Methanocorpusculum equi]